MVSVTLTSLPDRVAQAVANYWLVRKLQSEKQIISGRTDQGSRSAVTGGAQMHGFVQLFTQMLVEAGIDERYVFHQKALQLPGFFRPTKEWDLLVVRGGQLLAALEVKSQAGPSFGNNFNNRTEEALGSALDLWTAFREGALNRSAQPFVGYCLMLEDCPASRVPVRVQEPHFQVMPEFASTSYMQRYELFCRKLVRERHYTASALLTSRRDGGLEGHYTEPAADLTVVAFARSLIAHVTSHDS